ncbi:unnamed protein product [Spirodela intermedia]|uniref:Uncharacterized protein n=1 Tax=Spirodela intermedia TaxID=51605 RepID=A0A7I8IAF2_SPIIN|nr:unnamed protein product [Spirodela intermedia]CAA6654655.1 unnamed protein product [Spirodela intermedia]
MGSLQSWVSNHKLAGAGAVFASAVGASLVYARGRGRFQARRCAAARQVGDLYYAAQAGALVLAFAALTGAALRQYYDVMDDVLEHVGDAPATVPEGFFDPVADW